MNTRELDARINSILAAVPTRTDPSKSVDDIKHLIRDCVKAVTPERPVIYEDDMDEGIDVAIDAIEANTQDLLG